MSEQLNAAASTVRETAEKQLREAVMLEAVAAVPAFAAFPAKLAYVHARQVCLVAEASTREEAAAVFEALAAQVEPLPVVAYKGVFAGVKPACDYQARDGDILLDGGSALPVVLDCDGFHGGGSEKLRAWFESETQRVAVIIQIVGAPSTVRTVKQESPFGTMRNRAPVTTSYQWHGLPHSNTRHYFKGAPGSPGSVTCLFDFSTDLASWLAGRNSVTVNA